MRLDALDPAMVEKVLPLFWSEDRTCGHFGVTREVVRSKPRRREAAEGALRLNAVVLQTPQQIISALGLFISISYRLRQKQQHPLLHFTDGPDSLRSGATAMRGTDAMNLSRLLTIGLSHDALVSCG